MIFFSFSFSFYAVDESDDWAGGGRDFFLEPLQTIFWMIFFFGGQTLLIMFFSLIDLCYMILPSRHEFFFFFVFCGRVG